mmetsp:Transcript_15705/g.32752  ORF Transcript_15705/g.32752 Transcript_15705/m.32752 type:complete len:272 (-) Transcript_15705:217-1032(-)
MWAPFFDLPCEHSSAAGFGHGSNSGSSSGATGDASTSGPSSRVPAASASKASSSSASAFAETKSAVAGTKGTVAGGAAAGSSATATRRPATAGGLRPGDIGIGTYAEGLKVQGLRVKGGSGRCLASVPVVQDRAYWEVHIIEVGGDLSSRLLVGTSAPIAPGNDALQQDLGIKTRSYGAQFGAGGEAPLQAGDVISVTYDQAVFPVAVNVWHNGVPVPAPVPRGLNGEQWPALFIRECTVDWALGQDHWKFASVCPSGFSAIMPSRGLIGD